MNYQEATLQANLMVSISQYLTSHRTSQNST